MRFKRILLKLSGESLMGEQGFGIDPHRLSDYAQQIRKCMKWAFKLVLLSVAVISFEVSVAAKRALIA